MAISMIGKYSLWGLHADEYKRNCVVRPYHHLIGRTRKPRDSRLNYADMCNRTRVIEEKLTPGPKAGRHFENQDGGRQGAFFSWHPSLNQILGQNLPLCEIWCFYPILHDLSIF